MFGIEQKRQRAVAVERHFDMRNVADFPLVGDRTDGAFAGL